MPLGQDRQERLAPRAQMVPMLEIFHQLPFLLGELNGATDQGLRHDLVGLTEDCAAVKRKTADPKAGGWSRAPGTSSGWAPMRSGQVSGL